MVQYLALENRSMNIFQQLNLDPLALGRSGKGKALEYGYKADILCGINFPDTCEAD
jgi:hypothetical protein